MSDERTEVIFGAKITELTAGMREAQESVKESVEVIKGHMETLNASVGAIRSAFLAFTAVLAGGEMFEKAIEHTAELGASLEVMSKKTGIAADELSRLRFAANISEVSAGSLDTGLTKMARGMQGAEQDAGAAAKAYTALGISVTDAEGHLRPVQQVFLDVADKFHGMEDGAGKTAIAMNLFGRSGADLIPLLNQGREEVAKLEQESDKLGNTMSEKTIAASIEYVEAMKRVKAESRGFAQSVATEVMPILSGLANNFTDSGIAADGTSVAVELIAGTMRVLGTAIVGVKYSFQILWDAAKFVLTTVGDAIGGVAAAIDLAVHGHFADAKTALKGIAGDMSKNWDEMTDDMVSSTQKAHDTIAGLFGFNLTGDKHEGPGKAEGAAAPSMAGIDEKSTQLQDAEAEWQVERDKTDAQGDALLAMEREFWAKKVGEIRQGEKDTDSATKAMNGKRMAAEHKLQGDLQGAMMIEAQSRATAQLATLDVEKQEIEERRALHEIDAKTAQAQLIANAERARDIQINALSDEYDLAYGNVVKQEQLWQKMEAAKRAADARIAVINKDTTKSVAKDWDSALGTITNSIRKSFDGVIAGTQTLRDALRNVWRNMALDFAASKLEEVKTHLAAELAKRGITTGSVAHHVLSQLAMTAASVAGATARLAVEVASSIKSMAISAATAFMGMTAWLSDKLGPFAIPVAAGAAAGAFALGTGMLASASGGYDIPAGINPMTQLHAQEMVLPADLANRVRGMTDGGGSGSGGHVYHIHAMDAKSFTEFAKANPEAFGHGFAGAVRINHGAMNDALKRRT